MKGLKWSCSTKALHNYKVCSAGYCSTLFDHVTEPNQFKKKIFSSYKINNCQVTQVYGVNTSMVLSGYHKFVLTLTSIWHLFLVPVKLKNGKRLLLTLFLSAINIFFILDNILSFIWFMIYKYKMKCRVLNEHA